MKNNKFEGNIIIGIDAMKRIMGIFLGPFLTAYFIKTSTESMSSLSIYYIFSFTLLGLGSILVTKIIKNKFKIGMFRIGVIINFIYIMTIIILREKIVDNLALISILYGISSAAYWSPYNLFLINKIDNSIRTSFTVKSEIIKSTIGIICPLILGSVITATNYELTAVIILIISIVQIILSFILSPDDDTNLPKYDLKSTWYKITKNRQARKMLLVEFLMGLNGSDDSALGVLVTILIFNTIKTNMNLGVITSISTLLSIICVYIYGERYKNKDDKYAVIISSILPVVTLFIMLYTNNGVTLILYNFIYIIFTKILNVSRSIRLFNMADSHIVTKDIQAEFLSIREGILNIGRITSYILLLIAGISGNQLILNIMMIILTLSILATGLNIRMIEKFEE